MGPWVPLSDAAKAHIEAEAANPDLRKAFEVRDMLQQALKRLDDTMEARHKLYITKLEEIEPALKDKHWHLDTEKGLYQVEIPAGQSVVRRPAWVDDVLKENEDEG